MFKNLIKSKPQEQTVSLLGESLEQKCQKATDKTMNNPDDELIQEVVEHILESDRDVSSKDVAQIMRRRLSQDNVHKQYLALALVEQVLQKCSAQLGDTFLDDVLYHVALVATRTNRRQHPEFPETKRKALDILRTYGRRGQHALQLAVRSGGNPNLNMGGIMSFAGGYGTQQQPQQNHYGHLHHTGEQLGNRFYGQQYQQQMATAPDSVLIEDVNIVVSQCYSYIDLIQDLILTKSDPKAIQTKSEQNQDDQFNDDVVIQELLSETQKLKEQLPVMLQRLQSMDGPEAVTTLIQSLEATDILDNAIKLHAEVVAEAQKAALEQAKSPTPNQAAGTERAGSTLGDLITFDQLASHNHQNAPQPQQGSSGQFQSPTYAQQYPPQQYNSFSPQSQALTPYQGQNQGQAQGQGSYGMNTMASDLDSLARQTTGHLDPQKTAVNNPQSALVLYDNNQGTSGQNTGSQFNQPQGQYSNNPNQQTNMGGQPSYGTNVSQFPSRQLSKTTSNVGEYQNAPQGAFQNNQNFTSPSANVQAFMSPRYKQSSSFNVPQGQGSSGLYPTVGQVSTPTNQGLTGQPSGAQSNYNYAMGQGQGLGGQQSGQQQFGGQNMQGMGGQQNGNLNVTGAGYNNWSQQQSQQKQQLPYSSNLAVTGANYSQPPNTSPTTTNLNVTGAGYNQNKNNPFTYIDPVDRLRQQTSYQTTPMNRVGTQQPQGPNSQGSGFPNQGGPYQQSGNQGAFQAPLQKSSTEGNNFYQNSMQSPQQGGQYQQNQNQQNPQQFQGQNQGQGMGQGMQTPQKTLQSYNSMGNYATGSFGNSQSLNVGNSVQQQNSMQPQNSQMPQGQYQQQQYQNQPQSQQSMGSQWSNQYQK